MKQSPLSGIQNNTNNKKDEKKTSVTTRKKKQESNLEEEYSWETNSWENFFINTENRDETVQMLVESVQKCLDIILANNSEDGTHPKAVFGFRDGLPDVKKSFARWTFPKKWSSIEEVTKLFFDNYKMGINPGSPTYMGHMLPSLNRIALISGVIASILNQNMIAHEVAPVFTQMENQVVSYLANLIGYDIQKSGWAIVSWGTTANHTAMLVARNRLIPWIERHWVHKALKIYNEANNTDFEDIVIFVWDDAHYSIEKLAGYIWIWSEQVKKIPFRNGSHSDLDIDILHTMIDNAEKNKQLLMGISITAGTTEKWNIHNIKEILWVAKHRPTSKEIYVHVDAAHGWGFLTNNTIKDKYFEGIQNADSVTIDGHKMFYTNYGCGGIIFKDQKSLWYIKQSAPYVLPENSENENHGSYTLEWSRGSVGTIELWMSTHFIAKEWYSVIMNELIYKSKMLERLLHDDERFEILWEVELNVLCFRYIPRTYLINSEESINNFNTLLRQKLLHDGDYYLSGTEIEKKSCFRTVIMNLPTKEQHIEKLIAKLHLLSNEIIEDIRKESEKNMKHSDI